MCFITISSEKNGSEGHACYRANYICYYFDVGAGEADEMMQHVIENHSGTLKYRKKQLDAKTGLYIYGTENYCVPTDKLQHNIGLGFTPFVDEVNKSIRFRRNAPKEPNCTQSVSPACKKIRCTSKVQ